MAGAIIDYILIELSCKSEFALLIDPEFTEPTTSIKGHFFIIPNPEGLEIILRSIDIKNNLCRTVTEKYFFPNPRNT